MDTVSKAKRSEMMSRVRSKGNKSTELKLIALLRAERLSGWRRNYPLLGKPDLVYPRARLAIFIDGCFWHKCPKCYRRPSTRKAFWDAKAERNVARDRLVTRELRRKGWRVLRVWEHALKLSPPKVLARVRAALSAKP